MFGVWCLVFAGRCVALVAGGRRYSMGLELDQVRGCIWVDG